MQRSQRFRGKGEGADPAREAVSADYDNDARRWVDSVIATLDDEEKAGMMLMPGVYARADASTLALVKGYVKDMHVGGLVLLKGTAEEARILCDSIARWSDIPLFIAIDAEWGLGMRLSDRKSYPVNSRLGDVTANDMFDYGYEVGMQAREIGINMILGPVVDVSTEGRNGYISFRTFQGDAKRVAQLGTAYSKGVEESGVLSCAKHFPGHGSVGGDSHKLRPVISKSRNELDSIDLFPFREYINNGLSCIMAGHLSAPSLDSTGRCASDSEIMITELLRGEMGFRGLVLTDAISMGEHPVLEPTEHLRRAPT